MMSTREERVAIVRGIYEDAVRGDVDSVLEAVHEDVDWAGEADPPVSPWDGLRKGKDAVTQFFADLDSVNGLGKDNPEDARFEPMAWGTSENEVFVFIRYEFIASTTGKKAAMNLHHYWRFRDDKVEFFRGSEDTAQLASIWKK